MCFFRGGMPVDNVYFAGIVGVFCFKKEKAKEKE